MSRWDTYLDRIDEKVSKKEMNDALKNNNVYVGMEFEFKSNIEFDPAGTEASDLAERAYDEVQEYNKQVDDYEEEMEEYRNDTEELRDEIERKQERIDTLEQAIEDLGEHNEELDEQLADAEDLRDDIEAELDDHNDEEQAIWDDDDTAEEWKDKKAELEQKFTDAKKEVEKVEARQKENELTEEMYQNEIDQLERHKDDDEDQLRYREEEGIYEEIETPYASEYSMPDYWEYMQNWHGYGENELYTEPGERLDDPPSWENDYDASNFEEAVEGTGILNSAPFDDYRIGEYGSTTQRIGDKFWGVEPDQSLGENGIEVKNPPMQLPKFVDYYLDDMLDWIDDVGYTDNDCGLHAHMSLRKSKGELDFLKLILFTDEQWIFGAFESRFNNSYTNSVKDKLKSDGIIPKRDIDKLFKSKKLAMKLHMNSAGYDAIKNIDPKTGHVEFRYMGGAGYEDKGKEIKATLATYAHNLSLAMDPEYKKKEYVLKLQRIFNKMELFWLDYLLEIIDITIERIEQEGGYLEKEDIKVLNLHKRKYQKSRNKLASIYKIDHKTHVALSSNRGFMEGVRSDTLEALMKGLHSSGGAFGIMRDVVYRG